VKTSPRNRGISGPGKRRTSIQPRRIRQQPADWRPPVIMVKIQPAFVAPTPSLAGFTDNYVSVNRENTGKLAPLFRTQVERWKEDTQLWSSVTKMLAHPSYLRIVGLARESNGTEIERLLLEELELEPDYWFDALSAITGENPVLPEHNFDQSVEAWLRWGRDRGIITN
jgi:hypothetical protein